MGFFGSFYKVRGAFDSLPSLVVLMDLTLPFIFYSYFEASAGDGTVFFTTRPLGLTTASGPSDRDLAAYSTTSPPLFVT